MTCRLPCQALLRLWNDEPLNIFFANLRQRHCPETRYTFSTFRIRDKLCPLQQTVSPREMETEELR